MLDWPGLFRGVLDIDELRGIVVWRAGQDAVRVVSDDLLVVTPAAALRSNLELTLPMDGSSPELDLRTGISGFDIAAVPQYLPANKMPPTVVAWLDSALRGGRATSAELTFVGPVRPFPFDGGEGEFARRPMSRTASSRSFAIGRWRRISTAPSSSSTRASRHKAAAACSATARPICASASAICVPAISR